VVQLNGAGHEPKDKQKVLEEPQQQIQSQQKSQPQQQIHPQQQNNTTQTKILSSAEMDIQFQKSEEPIKNKDWNSIAGYLI
jgi:hypothetical protein